MSRPALLAVLLLVVTLAPSAARAGEVHVGDPLPAFTLPDAQGHPFSPGVLRGRVAVVDFWASWCEHCRTALPALEAMSKRHASDGLLVVAVGIDRDPAKADRFLAEYVPERTMTLLRDPAASLLARVGAQGMPALYVVDTTGIVRLVLSGYTADQLGDVERLVESLLQQPAGAVAEQ